MKISSFLNVEQSLYGTLENTREGHVKGQTLVLDFLNKKEFTIFLFYSI